MDGQNDDPPPLVSWLGGKNSLQGCLILSVVLSKSCSPFFPPLLNLRANPGAELSPSVTLRFHWGRASPGAFIGQTAAVVHYLRPGYRLVPLLDRDGTPIPPRLLVKVQLAKAPGVCRPHVCHPHCRTVLSPQSPKPPPPPSVAPREG